MLDGNKGVLEKTQRWSAWKGIWAKMGAAQSVQLLSIRRLGHLNTLYLPARTKDISDCRVATNAVRSLCLAKRLCSLVRGSRGLRVGNGRLVGDGS